MRRRLLAAQLPSSGGRFEITSGPDNARGLGERVFGSTKWSWRFPMPMHPSPDGGQLKVSTSEIGGLAVGSATVDHVLPPSWVDSIAGSLYAPAGLSLS